MVGGGVAQGREAMTTLYGGRNADFFFAELSLLDTTDGDQSPFIDGGKTADDTSDAAWQQSPAGQRLAADRSRPTTTSRSLGDLLEEDGPGINDDHDVDVAPVTGWTSTTSRTSTPRATCTASSTTWTSTSAAGDGMSDEAGSTNYGLGSSAQLEVSGSAVANIIIGGYDNDLITAQAVTTC